jgi:amino acid adenylation domain-containing protein/thioester reductase-like protein
MFDATHADLSFNDPQELPGLFSKCADMTPNTIAVVHGRETITYKELDLLSNRYADFLHQMHRIERGDMVCVAYDRGINFIVAILSILKCGAAYVPIDAKEPAERRCDIIDDVNPKLILVQPKHRDEFDFPNCISIEDLHDIYTFSPAAKQPHIHSQDLACVFFTSGSTGRPKGVLLPHLAITGLIRSPRYLTITPEDRVLSSSSIAFDAASFEIWTALANSATLVCIDYETIINPEAYAAFLDHQDITVMWVTSALFDQLVAFQPGMFRKVKYLLSGGDVVNPKTVYKVLNNDKGRPMAFINGYGPTETGILATFQMITEMHNDGEPLPIGKALADTVLYVLDEEQKPVAPGEPGELYIGGHRLAKGYLNLQEKTAQSFLRNPFTGSPTDILYRTGDLVRFRPDGSLEFTGRADRQIKFRGFRLELDGIENVLVSHQDVANAAVKMVKVNAEKTLVGYVQAESGSRDSFSVTEFKSYLKQKLPSYSVPAIIMVLDRMPLTQRGKIDRKQLPTPVLDEEIRDDIVNPRSETEKILHGVWSQCLGRKKFGVTDNFFDLGGSSILLATVYTEIRKQVATSFTLDAFLENPTIEGLAGSIDERDGQADHTDEGAAIERDATLDASILPSWDSSPASDGNAVLLTGSTGFLGSHLLAEILKGSDRPVYCLIRPRDDESLHEHQQTALRRFALEQTPGGADRIRPVAGDLAERGLGLSSLDHQRILDNCSHIIHCGAWVHHIYPYGRLKAANSFSTLELIKFALRGQPKKLAFVSTASAITECDAQGVGYEGQVGKHPASFFGGYAMSKWVSERLMKQAFGRGMSGLVLRPGNVFANSETGISSPVATNYALLMMRAYLDSGLAPDLDLVFEAVPVNQLAQGIVALTLGDCDQAMLNLSNPRETSLQEYIELVSTLTGKAIKIIPFDEWKQKVIDPLRESSPLYPLTLYFQGTPSKEIMHFDTSRGQEELASHGVTYSSDYSELLRDAFDKTLRGALGLS